MHFHPNDTARKQPDIEVMPAGMRQNHQNAFFDGLIHAAGNFPSHQFEKNKPVNNFLHRKIQTSYGKISIIHLFLASGNLAEAFRNPTP
jgi:hypothetical protein